MFTGLEDNNGEGGIVESGMGHEVWGMRYE